MGREIHVSKRGNDWALGTQEQPLLTISKAAKIALPGDHVIVHEGVYREWVKPEHGGASQWEPIVYAAKEGEHVVIKGSEEITTWEQVKESVWKVVLPNEFFGDYNPYGEKLFGDWLIYPVDWSVHAGEVYLNGVSLYEAYSLEDVYQPQQRTHGYNPPWTQRLEPILNPEQTVYQWFSQVTEDTTTIYANFQGKNPNDECVEINVRKCCFYPELTRRDYITVRGFEMAQAASPWTPPTADQPGLIGANWSKGWIIENNRIHDAKCSGISIGKEASTGHNLCSITHRKPGYQYQMEAVFKALQIGWSKETIGSHIIRNNEIYDCGQNGIVGHLGCIFSEIHGNHIYNIGVKHEFFGYEIAGIKLHTPIDVQIRQNNIHNCSLGIWLDWQAQGTRVSKNLLYENDRDLMIEVTHGPHLVDCNIFASEYNLDNMAHGGAYIQNLCCGTMRREPVLNRATPYHFPHSTQPAGTTFVFGGDDRWYQNIFVGGAKEYIEQSKSGTGDYNGSPASFEEYINQLISLGKGDHEVFEQVKSPVYIDQNAYINGAQSFDREENLYRGTENPKVKISTEDGKTYLEMYVTKEMLDYKVPIMDSKFLKSVRIAEANFETPEGEEIVFNTDFGGNERGENTVVGPFVGVKVGYNKIRVW